MIPCSNCKHFTTDCEYDGEDEYEVPVCEKKMPLCLQYGLKCEKQITWKKQSYNRWKDWFEEKIEDSQIKIFYITRSFGYSAIFIKNLFDELKKKGFKNIKYIPETIIIETEKFKIYGFPLNLGCVRIRHKNVKYYINRMNAEDREITENERERYKCLLQAFPRDAIEIKSEELIKILESEIEE